MRYFAARALWAIATGAVLSPPAYAQIAPPAAPSVSSPAPATPAPVDNGAPTGENPGLYITDGERGSFALGDALAEAAFSYAPLVQRASLVARTSSGSAELDQMALLAPDASSERLSARDGLTRALALMPQLDAPADATAPVTALAAKLAKPVALDSNARTLAQVNVNAADVLGSLAEAQDLSSLLDNPALKSWLAQSVSGRTGPVWYADGVLAGIARIAAENSLTVLLPPVSDLATDLRGMRDWLSTRQPDTPTSDQAMLQGSIDQLLAQTASLVANRPHSRRLTTAQLQQLGDISRRLRQLILGPSDTIVSPQITAQQPGG